MEVRSEGPPFRTDKLPLPPPPPRTCVQVWFIHIYSNILLWTCIVQLVALGELWNPRYIGSRVMMTLVA
uniref:Uncharacterized protein n=1 Tax=Nelumbo nucifera TaxID=4432 RepID=A0A822ZGB7_NELNU|nr:TPA_asm: hypothetical protein HUJ06_000951 [Nelumbo nucifera]